MKRNIAWLQTRIRELQGIIPDDLEDAEQIRRQIASLKIELRSEMILAENNAALGVS